MKKYFTTVKTKGLFKNRETRETWSSNLCSVSVSYDIKKDKSNIKKVYRQRSRTSDEWIHPHFSKKSMRDIQEKSKWNYETFVLKENNSRRKKAQKAKKRERKHHLEEKCERCLFINRYCKG